MSDDKDALFIVMSHHYLDVIFRHFRPKINQNHMYFVSPVNLLNFIELLFRPFV